MNVIRHGALEMNSLILSVDSACGAALVSFLVSVRDDATYNATTMGVRFQREV